MFDRNQDSTPQTPAAAHGRARGIGRRLIAIGALASTLVAANAGTVHAWSYADPHGSAGAVAVPQILANDTQIYADNNFYMNGHYYTAPMAIASLTIESAASPIVYRSPASTGDQDVIGFYELDHWDGSDWVTLATTKVVGRIPAGYDSVQLPKVGFTPTGGKGYYRVGYAFAWKVGGLATTLGTTIVLPDSAADFGCSSSLRPCEVGPTYVRVGALYQLGGGW